MDRNLPEKENNLTVGAGKQVENWLSKFVKELTERFQKMEEVLVVDRIENDIAVCENRNTGKMYEKKLSSLPQGTKEGSILKWKNGVYSLDNSGVIEERIENKMKDVWKD